MRAPRVLPGAEEELAAAAEWYEDKRPGLGADFVAAVDAAFEGIRARPPTPIRVGVVIDPTEGTASGGSAA